MTAPPAGLIAQAPLAPLTTLRIGGPAAWLAEVDSAGKLDEVLAWARTSRLRHLILGLGSNVLVDDRGVDGLVIRLGGAFAEWSQDPASGLVRAGGGVQLQRLGARLAGDGHAACAFMACIPGTVGAAVRINAGTTRWGEMADVLVSAEVLAGDGTVRTLAAADLALAYRSSRLCADPAAVVLSALIDPGPRAAGDGGRERLAAITRERAGRQPRSARTCGSVFKRPAGGEPAGWYLDRAGMRGLRHGDAQVADEHANWIVNRGAATAADVRALIAEGTARVQAQFGVMLQREVIYLPEDLWTS
jgi:UDP-N-acetylmuramate dehydrogenase